jgi:4-hydroxy-tetrahydrodipicolinate synthase
MKCACSLLGICDDLMAEPFERFRPTERAKIKSVLESLSLLATEKPAHL